MKLNGLEVTDVYDKGGKYSNPNITVQDANGNTIQLYKAVIDKNADGTWRAKKGDKLNITAAVGKYMDNYQLRNTLSGEIAPFVDPADPMGIWGKNVVIYNPVVNKVISKTADGYNRACQRCVGQPVRHRQLLYQGKGCYGG